MADIGGVAGAGAAAGGAAAGAGLEAQRTELLDAQDKSQAGFLEYQGKQVNSQAKFLMASSANKMQASIAQAMATFANSQAQAAARA
ncbi:MAG TPA: hypothetical protein ENJ51_07175 [Leucothrix mucor]|uniref:Uncharacterized protein n=1 Tax=Leucothrix mucor TaxID=45248 RepID=A0A7V2T001_LEUMU|nr:hypothetical protein [Leucothrix mucor]